MRSITPAAEPHDDQCNGAPARTGPHTNQADHQAQAVNSHLAEEEGAQPCPPYPRIIVGASGSPGSLRALRYAQHLARDLDATLVPVLAWLPPGGDLADRRTPDEELRRLWAHDARQRLQDTLTLAWGTPPGRLPPRRPAGGRGRPPGRPRPGRRRPRDPLLPGPRPVPGPGSPARAARPPSTPRRAGPGVLASHPRYRPDPARQAPSSRLADPHRQPPSPASPSAPQNRVIHTDF
jgi:hypothetical protein